MTKNPAAVALGRLGGSKNTEAQNKARRLNGKLGGRPRNAYEVPGLSGPSHTADFYVPRSTNRCVICGKVASGNLGVAAHLRWHVERGDLVSAASRHRRGAMKYGKPK